MICKYNIERYKQLGITWLSCGSLLAWFANQITVSSYELPLKLHDGGSCLRPDDGPDVLKLCPP